MASKFRQNCEVGEGPAPSGETGKIKFSETEPIEGKRSIEVPANAPTTEPHRYTWSVASGALPAGANNQNEYARIYYNNPGDPKTDVTIFGWGNFAEGRYLELVHKASGKLQLLRNGSSVVGETAGKLPLGPNYPEVRMLFGTTIANGQAEARLNGESFALNNACNLGAGLTYDQMRVGVCNSTGGPGEITIRIDALAINDSTGESNNSYVGSLTPEAPQVKTEAATGVGGAVATPHALVNPKGSPTSCWFEYGKDKTYGSKSEVIDAKDGQAFIAVEKALSGLEPNTEYHFRVVAENKIGKATGEDATFKTGVGPSGDPVKTSFRADHETGDLSEYDDSSTLHGVLRVLSPGGYGGGSYLQAEVFEPDGFARGHALDVHTEWLSGQVVRCGCAIYLEPGFYEKRQGQVDFLRWDNTKQDAKNTERGGVVMQSTDKQFRLVRIREAEPDEQHTFNLDGKGNVIGPEILEGRYYWVEWTQKLWHEDTLALNVFYIEGNEIASSTDKNTTRPDLIVSRLRAGIVATSSKQTNPILARVDRVCCGPLPLIGPITSDRLKFKSGGAFQAKTRKALTVGGWA